MNKLLLIFCCFFLIMEVGYCSEIEDIPTVKEQTSSEKSGKLSDKLSVRKALKAAEKIRVTRSNFDKIGQKSKFSTTATRQKVAGHSNVFLKLDDPSKSPKPKKIIKAASSRSREESLQSPAEAKISDFLTRNLGAIQSASSADISDSTSNPEDSPEGRASTERTTLLDSAQRLAEKRAAKFREDGLRVINEVKKYLPPEQAKVVDSFVADISEEIDRQVIDLKAAAEGKKEELDKIATIITDKLMSSTENLHGLGDLFTKDDIKELLEIPLKSLGKDFDKNLQASVKEKVMKLGKRSLTKLAKKFGMKAIKGLFKPARVIKFVAFVASIVIISLLIKHHFKKL